MFAIAKGTMRPNVIKVTREVDKGSRGVGVRVERFFFSIRVTMYSLNRVTGPVASFLCRFLLFF